MFYALVVLYYNQKLILASPFLLFSCFDNFNCPGFVCFMKF